MEERKITVDLTAAAKIMGYDDENILSLMDKEYELDLNKYCENASYYMQKYEPLEKHRNEIHEAYEDVWENMFNAYFVKETLGFTLDEFEKVVGKTIKDELTEEEVRKLVEVKKKKYADEDAKKRIEHTYKMITM